MAGYVNKEHNGSPGFQPQHTEKDQDREGWRAYVQNEGKAIYMLFIFYCTWIGVVLRMDFFISFVFRSEF